MNKNVTRWFKNSRLVQSCRLYHTFRLLGLFFFLIMLSIFLADTADAQWGTTTVDNTGSTGEYTSIAVGSSGAVYISYYDSGANDNR
ncbi:MAG: hypothetical protein HYW13_01195 [Planctomycetes bacterium]|nr:hypothetical protein [Planctomycetota bacterium]